MMQAIEEDAASLLDTLTGKQRDVLDLLIEHKTSKEIARILNISPHTVDQRINFAKKKLAARTRGELASTYRHIKEVYGKTVYEESHIAEPDFCSEGQGRDDASAYLFLNSPSGMKSDDREKEEIDYRVVPEVFEGDTGKRNRIFSTVGIAILIIILGISGLAIFSVISEIFVS